MSVEERERNFDALAPSTQDLLLIIYSTRKQYIEAKEIHPIDQILVYSYDQAATLYNNTRNAALLAGIMLPISCDENVIFRDILTRYLNLEKDKQVSLREIIRISVSDYAKTEMSKTASYGRRTDAYIERYYAKLKT